MKTIYFTLHVFKQLFKSKYRNNIEDAIIRKRYALNSVINEKNNFKYNSRTTKEYCNLTIQEERIKEDIKLLQSLL